MRISKYSLFLAGALTFAVAGPAFAANPNYAHGDLVLFFQKYGVSNTVYVNLGNTALDFRGAAAGAADGVNKVGFLNLNSTLTSAFGEGWASDPDIYAGLAGVWGTSNTNSSLQHGDPHRTLYVSASRSDVGTVGQAGSTGWVVSGTTAMDGAAGGIVTMNNPFENTYSTAIAIAPTGDTTSNILMQNPFNEGGGLRSQGTAFSTFAGGVQQQGATGTFGSFGAAGQVEFALDLYRILARNNVPNQVGGDVRTGSYEGTVTIGTDGAVSFIAQGSGPTPTPFQTWVNGYPALDTEAKKLPSADPDQDGLTNLMEFTLNGNPGVPDVSIRPAVATNTNDVVFSFNRRDEILTGYTLQVQYGSNLTGWTDITVPAASGASGGANVTVTDGPIADAVSVALPKSLGAGGKLFARLLVGEVPAP